MHTVLMKCCQTYHDSPAYLVTTVEVRGRSYGDVVFIYSTPNSLVYPKILLT
jgi:hypothetical protein